MSDEKVFSESSRYYDNTMLSTYKECPRRYFLRHILNWTSSGIARPLAFGLAWHNAMDQVWSLSRELPKRDLARRANQAFQESWEEQGLPVEMTLEQIEHFSPRTPMIAREMLASYIDTRWGMLQDSHLIQCEQPFAVPLPGATNTWYVGKLDKVISYNGQLLVIEHKSTTEYAKASGFKSSYIESWYTNAQVKGYQYGGGLFFPGLSQVWVDASLVHKTVHNAFRFVPVAHQFPLLQEWVDDTRQWVARVESDTARFESQGCLGNGVFPKNEEACIGKYGPCQFLDVCRTTPDPTKLDKPPDRYVEEKWEPFELLKLEKLTNDKEPS